MVSDNYYTIDYYKVRTNATAKQMHTVELTNCPPGYGRFNSTSISEMVEWMTKEGYLFKVLEHLPGKQTPNYICLIGNY